MSAFIASLSRVSGSRIGVELLKQVATLCAAILGIWLLSATYGLDLSPGFF